MSADARILDITKSIELQLECHVCGKDIDLDYPHIGHADCADDNNQVKVYYRFKNLEW